MRNAEEHPVDPGWEDGEYIRCHPDIRPITEVGTWLLDTVARLNESRKREAVVRSAFKVNMKDSRHVLGFSEFYFSDSEPIVLPGHFIQYRIQNISGDDLKSILNLLQSTYTLYKTGERPRSISSDDWELMRKIRRRALNRPY